MNGNKSFFPILVGFLQVKSIILSMFIHSFTVYKWPQSLLNEITNAIRNFLWNGSPFSSKMVVVD